MMQLDLFLGRFHPLFVHLPIGILVLAFLLEVVRHFIKKDELLPVIRWTYFTGFLASLMAVITGLLLSGDNAYPIAELNYHKFMGILTMLAALGLFILKSVKKLRPNLSFSVILLLLVGITGHLGGTLTHGESYLTEYGPEFIQSSGSEMTTILANTPEDSIYMLRDVIRPILQQKCAGCHTGQDAYGKFNIESYSELFREGDTGTPVVPGNPGSSELFRRVSLPTTSEKFMPPRGDGLSYTEILILKQWIKDGADSLARFVPEQMDAELIALLKRDYNKDFVSRPFYEKIAVDSLDEQVYQKLAEVGFVATRLGETNNYLDVRSAKDSLGKMEMEVLELAAGHIIFLDLGGKKLTDENIEPLGRFNNLVRLNLHNNPITDSAMAYLENLERLESLNLFQTSVGDVGVSHLLGLPSLRSIYLLATEVTPDYLSSARANHPKLDLVSTFKFEEIPDSTDVKD